MEFINYISAVVLSYVGLGVGIALAYIAKEELEFGKKYFVVMQNMLLFALVFAVIYFLGFNWIPWIILIGFTVFIVTIQKQRKKSFMMYLLFSVLFWASSQPHAFFPTKFVPPLIASLIFLAGFPTGSLLIDVKTRNISQIVLSTIHFVVISLVLYFV